MGFGAFVGPSRLVEGIRWWIDSSRNGGWRWREDEVEHRRGTEGERGHTLWIDINVITNTSRLWTCDIDVV